MKITNKLNLPKVFETIFENDEHKIIENRYSVTELLKPIREIKLFRKYYNELTTDVNDGLTALFGTAVHEYFEKYTEPNIQTEIKMEMQFGKYTLVGRADFIDRDIVGDYKTCSVSKIVNADFEDWKKQGLMYAYMQYFKYNNRINKLKFYALMKDWSKIKSVNSATYPKSPIYVFEYDIKDTDYIGIEEYIKSRFKALDNDELPECSESDKWYTGTKYAVYKNEGDKRAVKVFDTLDEAREFMPEGFIECRLGQNLKCELYCDVKKYCGKIIS